ncbi:Plasmodium vivax Vir protein, putative [Plasmodium vivax]|uniref:Vir protein, putative n=1 Tax=Plasmodium vivax TaxID=5855 RepID=A0A1G4EG25_PLAVI|nr:Plasmodium vivax Vir protein, putative [Plasmodium vivax]
MSEQYLSYYENANDKIEVGNLLKNKTLYKFYEELDMKLVNKIRSPDCNVCESQLNVNSAAKTNLVNLCYGVCNIMLNMGDIDIFCNKPPCDDLCNHMKFWIYEHLMKITTDETEVKSFYKPLESIMNRDAAKRKICDIKFSVNNNDFKIFKNVYDFLYTCKDIIGEISKKYDTEVKLYCKHIKEIVRYYNNIKGNCISGNKYTYCNTLDKFKSIFTYENQLDNICNNCKYEKTACTSGSIVEEIPCLKEKEIGPIHSMQVNDTANDTHNVIGIISRIAIFVIPIFGLLSIFYKFTPLGFWLRSRMRKKNNTHKNMSEGKYDILENTSRTEQFYPESKEYNLKYQ